MKPRAHLPLTIATLFALLLVLLALAPGVARADAGQAAGPIEDILDAINCAVVKAIQDLARAIGIILWTILKLCGMVGLLGDDFDTLFQSVITEALGAVTSGSIRTVIQGSLVVSLAILGLSLLARVLWPELRIVSFQRVIVWGLVIQAFLANGSGIYMQLEAFRTDLAEEIAGAVASGSVPGCGGDTVPTLLCIAGTTESEIEAGNLAELPDTLPPYAGSETIHDLYDHCVYNPAVYYGDGACNPDDPTGDPWDVLPSVQDALGSQVLDLVLAFLVLCYGVLHIALGLAAGMMFVLFPVAAIFAFYQPLEGFPVGVIKNYITIVLKSVVLLTLSGIVIRLFSVATPTFISMAAVALVALFLCFVMAKEALATLLGSVSFIGNSVGNIGANLGVTGGGAGSAALTQASPESRMAAMMIGGGPIAQAIMGAPNPYLHSLGGAGGGMIGGAGHLARAALGAAFGGSAGFLLGSTAAGRAAAAAPAPTPAAATTPTRPTGGSGTPAGMPGASTPAGTPSSSFRGSLPLPPTRAAVSAPTGPTLAPTDMLTGEPPAIPALQAAAAGDTAALAAWTPASARQIQDTATRLQAAPAEVQDNARELIRAGYSTAEQWQASGRDTTLPDGTLDPAFVDETVQAAPEAAGAFALAQAGQPASDQIRIGEVVALGAATQRTIPAPAVSRGFARAVKRIGAGGSLDTSLQTELGAGTRGVFGNQAGQAEQVAEQMQQVGLANDQGRQLVETVQNDLERNPSLTAQQFREGGGPGRQARMQAWDQATGDPETTDRIVDGLIGLGLAAPVTVRETPRLPAVPAGATPARAPAEPLPPTPAAAPAPQGESPDRPAGIHDQASAPASTSPAAPAEPPAPAPAEPLPAEPAVSPPAQAAVPAQDLDLSGQLRAWRLQTAQEAGRHAFHVFSDATLQEIAARRPQTLDELAAVKGIGPKKLERYGAAILAMTQAAQPTEEKRV